MTRKIILILSTLIALYYCFRFGYIWTAYGHGGQLLGIPFALIILITTIVFFATKSSQSKDKAFSFGAVYILTLTAFSVTIEIIRATMKNYFEFLYYEPGGYVNKIFLSWLIVGAIVLFFILRHLKNKNLEEGKV